ncbi:MAG: hemolysin family protein, partial [Phycisphaerales bacterium]|nr:hemolysin family protein [Phycisphaerales bacterium]
DERGASLVENAVEFGSAEVHEIMTPRIEIDGIMLTDDLAVLTESLHEVQHSRVPVYRESLDDIVGVLHVRDLLPYLGPQSKPFDLESLLRQPLIVPETMPVADLLAAFRDQGIRFAVVVDEYGGTAGIASAEDVLSELVGELETPESDGIEVYENFLEVEGWVHVDELNDRFELDIPEDDDYETVAGYLLTTLGRVPDARESYTCDAGRTFNITHATPTTIERVRILRHTAEQDP